MEAVVVILVHRDPFNSFSAPPGGDHKPPASWQPARREFTDHGCGNSNRARSIQFPIQKKHSREDPWHGDHSEINALHDFDFLVLPGAKVNPVAERERTEKNEAAKYQDGIQLESGKYLAGAYEYNNANQEQSASPHQPTPHHQLGRRGSQPARRT